jgi:alkaline phosphatase D
MHAGTTVGPNPLDATFGPTVRFARAVLRPNRPPSELQFSGTLGVDRAHALTAALHDLGGARRWATELAPAEG